MQLEMRLWTIDEYHRMIKTGILQPDDRVELIAGQIVKMAAKGTQHTVAGRRIERSLQNLLQGQAIVHYQDPIQLNDYSEPEPDIAVVKIDPLDYLEHHPTPADIYLLIEVADTTLEKDCNTKAQIYAQSGIAEYWVIDVIERKLYLFRDPRESGYQTQTILPETATISPLQFPHVTITVNQMLPPQL